MNVNNKFFWDEAINRIDAKFTDEAAELMSRHKGKRAEETDDGYPGTAEPTMEIQFAPEERRRANRVMGGIFAGIAVAAAVAVAVGISAVRKSDDITSESSDNSSHTQSGVNLPPDETEDTHSILPDVKIDTDINSYKLDFSLYEQYFHGVWGGIYIGYSYSVPPDRMKISFDAITHIGFRQADGGCYMGIFSDIYEQFLYVSDSDPDTMYSGRFERDDSERYIADLDTTLSKSGDFEDKGNALSCMGMLKLCNEYGIDPVTLVRTGVMKGGNGKEYTLANMGGLYYSLDGMRFNGERVNESGQRQLCFSAKWNEAGYASSYATKFFKAFCVTETEDGWSAPEFCADYDPLTDDTPVCPSGLTDADGVDFGMIEDVLLGSWNGDDDYSSDIYINYTGDTESSNLLDPDWKSCYEDDSGWYFLICGELDIVYFVPKADPDSLYFYFDTDAAKSGWSLALRRTYNAEARNLELSGQITYTGEQRLFDMLGADFKDAFLASSFPYRREGRSPLNQYLNGMHYVCANEGVILVSISENEVKLSTRFVRDEKSDEELRGDSDAFSSDGDQLLIWRFFRKNDGTWDYHQPQCYIEGDFTRFYGMFYMYGDPDCDVYEERFFGDWISDEDGSALTVNYEENMFDSVRGTQRVCEGKDGWYMFKERSGLVDIYYIPFYDADSMYRYSCNDTEFQYMYKYEYDEAFRRAAAPEYYTGLTDGMRLCGLGLEKVCSQFGGNAGRDACRKAFNLGFIDEEGFVWKADSPYGEGELRLEQLEGGGYVLSCGFTGNKTTDTSKETKTERFKIAVEYGSNGDWTCVIVDDNGHEHALYDPYKDPGFAEIVDAYIRNDPDKSEELYYTAENLAMTEKYRTLAASDPDAAHELLYASMDYVLGNGFPKSVKGHKPVETDEPEEEKVMLPERGKISLYDLTTLKSSFPETLGATVDSCLSGWEITDDFGNKWTSDGLNGKDIYFIKRKSSYCLTLMLPFVGADMEERYFEVTFEYSYDYCHTAVETTPNSFDFMYTGDRLEVEGGYYLTTDPEALKHDGGSLTVGNSGKDAETDVYFYDESDGIYYPVCRGIVNLRWTTDGKNLFAIADKGHTLTSYGGTEGLFSSMSDDRGDGDSSLSGLKAEDIYFMGEYLVGEYELDGERKYCLFSAYCPLGMEPLRTDSEEIMLGTDLKTDESGFTLNISGEETRFDTTGDGLEGMYPLLKAKYALVYGTLRVNPVSLGSRYVGEMWGNEVCAGASLFPDYKAFRDWVGGIVAEEYIDDALSSCETKPTEIDGLLYYDMTMNYSPTLYSRFVLDGINYIDEDRAVLNIGMYGYTRLSYDALESIPAEEPSNFCTLIAVRTENGWRFTDLSAPIEYMSFL